MELNGIANIQMILEVTEIDETSKAKIMDQLDVLNRYMVVIGKELDKNEIKIPFWHEVRENRDKFKNNKGE